MSKPVPIMRARIIDNNAINNPDKVGFNGFDGPTEGMVCWNRPRGQGRSDNGTIDDSEGVVGSFGAKKPAYGFDLASDNALLRFLQGFRQNVNFIKRRVHPVAPFRDELLSAGVRLRRPCFPGRLGRVDILSEPFVCPFDIDKATPPLHDVATVKPAFGLTLVSIPEGPIGCCASQKLTFRHLC